jgi:hypothetical protein
MSKIPMSGRTRLATTNASAPSMPVVEATHGTRIEANRVECVDSTGGGANADDGKLAGIHGVYPKPLGIASPFIDSVVEGHDFRRRLAFSIGR